MEGPLSALTLEHREEPACWAQDLAYYDNWDFSPEGTMRCYSCCCPRGALRPDVCAKGQTPGPLVHTGLASKWQDERVFCLASIAGSEGALCKSCQLPVPTAIMVRGFPAGS